MSAFFRLPFSFPPAGAPLLALCLLYLLPGMVGHDPWKPDDAIHFGVAYSLLSGGDWLTPHLAGQPFLNNPPLYYWVAALCGKLFGGLLPLHDAIRLASALFGIILFAAIGGTAHRLFGEKAGSMATLVMLGSLGLVVHLHDTQPQIALLAAIATTWYGLALLPQKPLAGGVITGAAIGAGFLADGLTALAFSLPLLLLLPLLSAHWRTRGSLMGLLLALPIAAVICASWPLLLMQTQPAIFELWWKRETGSVQLLAGRWSALPAFLELLSWYTWPALPLAIWTLWRERRKLSQPGMVLGVAALFVTLSFIVATREARSLHVLPLLLPLVLLAVPAVAILRRGAANALDWFGIMTFSFIGALVWLGWVAMMFGWPERLARKAAKLEPGFVMQFSPLAVTFAAVLTLAWLWLIFSSPRNSPHGSQQGAARGVMHWAAGVVLMWGLVAALWLPWIDHGKSYRSLSLALAQAATKDSSCVIGRSVGQAQRASFHYFANIVTRDEQTRGSAECSLLLVQSTGRDAKEISPGGNWRKIWEGSRPGDRNERYRLYRR